MEQFGDFLDREELRTRRELRTRAWFLELNGERHRVYARASGLPKTKNSFLMDGSQKLGYFLPGQQCQLI